MLKLELSKLWPAIPGFLAALVLAWWLHGLSIDSLNLKHEKALIAQRAELQIQCEASKHITEDISSAYQKHIRDLNAQLSSFRLRQPSCIPIRQSSTAANGSNVAAPPHKPTNGNAGRNRVGT